MALSTALVPRPTAEETSETSLTVMPTPAPAKVIVRDPTEAELSSILEKMGLVTTPLRSYAKAMAHSVWTRLAERQGQSIYRTPTR